jgi:predicted RNA-binding protein YlxR (DUF448 family)
MAEGPQRMCIATGEHLPADELIRFVLGPQGEIVPDLQHELPGRGLWVRASRKALAKAIAEERFSKALRRKCSAAPDLPDRVESLIRARARQYLALANKAGLLVHGFEKVADALSAGRARVLIEASDGAEDGRRKLRQRLPEGCEIVAAFDSRELSLALGRANVIHAALAKGSLADKFLTAARRVEAFGSGAGKHG